MTEKLKHDLEAAAALVILVLLILWALWHAFGGSKMLAPAMQVGGDTFNGGTINIPPMQYMLPPSIVAGGGCGCGGSGSSCPVTANTVGTINQMLSAERDAAQKIAAASTAALNYGYQTGWGGQLPDLLLQPTQN